MRDELQQHVDVIVRCDCGSAHFCSVQYWRGEDWPEGYFEISMADRPDAEGLGGRLRAAWRMLRRGCVERNGVILNEAKAASLVAALSPIATASPASNV